MADIVNLRQFRKQKQRVEKAERADENRARSGQSKASRKKKSAEDETLRRTLDGARRDTPEDL